MSSDQSIAAKEMFPRSSRMIADAIEEAIFDAFGMDPPRDNTRPVRNARVERHRKAERIKGNEHGS